MESTQRVGLNQLRYCGATAAASPSVYGANEYGTVGNTWLDDKGAVGTGYPTITMDTSSKVLLSIGYRLVDVGNAVGFRSNAVFVFVKIDAATGFLNRYSYQANVDRMFVPVHVESVPVPLVAGTHTFTIGAFWANTNPAAGTLPILSDAYIRVLPLSAA